MSEMSGASAAERSAACERGPESPPDGISSVRAVAASVILVLVPASLLCLPTKADVRETKGPSDRACADGGSDDAAAVRMPTDR